MRQQINRHFGGFCVYSTLSDENLLFDTGLPGANRNGAAGPQGECQDDTSKTPGAFLNVFAGEDGPKGEAQDAPSNPDGVGI